MGLSAFQLFMIHQKNEIERYKWIESEKAGKDLGEEAVRVWISLYASRFRREWECHHGNLCQSDGESN